MVKKIFPLIQPMQVKKIWISILFVNVFILTFIFLGIQVVVAQGYYSQGGFYNYQPNYNTGNSASYYNSAYNLTTPSITYGTNFFNPSGNYTTSYTATTPNNYYVGNAGTSNLNSYTSSLYLPSSTISNFYNPSSNTTQGYQPAYSTLSSFYTGANSTYYQAPASPTTNSYNNSNSFANGSYYNASSTGSSFNSNLGYNPVSTSSYYSTLPNSSYTTPYYPASYTYTYNTGGYVTNAAVTNVSGFYEGEFSRKFSSTGAPTTNSRSPNSSMRWMYSTNDTFGSGDGTGCSSAALIQPIVVEVTQNGTSVTGNVTFYDSNDTLLSSAQVNGTIDSGGTIAINGTIGGIVPSTGTYNLKVSATVEDSVMNGVYTITDIATNKDIEIGSFRAAR